MRGVDRQIYKKRTIQQNGRWDTSRNSKRARRFDAETPPSGETFLKSPQSSVAGPFGRGPVPRALRATFSDLDGTLRSVALNGGAMQSLSRESIELAGRAVQKHIDASLKVVNSRTPEEFLIAQHDVLRTMVTEFTSSVHRMTATVSEIVG
jgi:hypothetical protein